MANSDLPVGSTAIVDPAATTHAIKPNADGSINIGSGGGGGTQYTDGGTPPANPIGGVPVFDNSGTWVDVGIDAPLPVQASALGATGDAAVVGDNTGSISAKMRGLTKIFNSVWDSTNNLFAANVKQIGGQAPTLDNTTIQAVSMRGKGAGTAGDTALLLDVLGQMTIEQFVQYQIMQGNGYACAIEAIATNAANAFVGIQLTANSIAKNVLIYRANAFQAQAFGVVRLYRQATATSDSNLGASGTAVNIGGTNSTALTAINVSAASTTETTGFQGTLFAIGGGAANVTYEALQNGAFIYLPKTTACGASIYTKVVTSANTASVGLYWIEW